MTKVMVILFLIVMALAVACVALIGKIHVARRKERQVKQNADEIIRKERENAKQKEKLDTGSPVDDFNNSIDILQDLYDRR